MRLSDLGKSHLIGGGGDYNESEQSLLSFSGSDMYCHLHHVNDKRAEATEDLLVILYDRENDGFFRPDMARIFTAMGGNAGGGGGLVLVGRGSN